MNLSLSHRRGVRLLALPLALALAVAACGGDDGSSSPATQMTPTTMAASTMPASDPAPAPADSMAEPMDPMTDSSMDSATICDADELVAAVEGGPAEGTLAGMADDPVGTAASGNPVLTTLVSAVKAAGLVDTLNSADALTVFAPTDCAFAALDPATLEAALADPAGLLTTVLGFHVVPERLEPAELAMRSTLTTLTGATLSVEAMGDTVKLNGGQARVVVPGIQTANATVYLIDAVLIPEG